MLSLLIFNLLNGFILLLFRGFLFRCSYYSCIYVYYSIFVLYLYYFSFCEILVGISICIVRYYCKSSVV